MPGIVVAQDEWSPKPGVAQDRFYCIYISFFHVVFYFILFILIIIFAAHPWEFSLPIEVSSIGRKGKIKETTTISRVSKSSGNTSSVKNQDKRIWQSNIRLEFQVVNIEMNTLGREGGYARLKNIQLEVMRTCHYCICWLHIVKEWIAKIRAASEKYLRPIFVLNLGKK